MGKHKLIPLLAEYNKYFIIEIHFYAMINKILRVPITSKKFVLILEF